MVHVVGVGNAEVVVEAVGGGEDFGEVAEMPLADAGGGVTVGGEVVGDGVFVGIESVGGFWEKNVAMHADALGIAAGEEGGAGGGADGAGDVEGGELFAFFGELIEVGGLDGFGAEAAEVIVALVVGEDDDDVGGRLCGAERRVVRKRAKRIFILGKYEEGVLRWPTFRFVGDLFRLLGVLTGLVGRVRISVNLAVHSQHARLEKVG